jgi:hypothetical protein
MGLAGRMLILSFGLLGPGKGYEAAIAALPAVVQADPSALYVILGATHPDLVRREGESTARACRILQRRSAWQTTSASSAATWIRPSLACG